MPSSYEKTKQLTYWELLECTNEVVRAVLPVQVVLRNGHPRVTIERDQVERAVAGLSVNARLFRRTFGRHRVQVARALLWRLQRDLGTAAAVSYRRGTVAVKASVA